MNKKNILLHGATNCDSSNYGDFIYGELVYEYLKLKGYKVDFYQPSKFFKEKIENYEKININKKNADLICYIPGGYFGEGHNAKFKENLVQFLRFMPLGIWASYKKKDMIVLGIGAGPINNILMKFGIKRICNHSNFVTTRDIISYNSLKKICPKANIINCGDLIISSKDKIKEKETEQIKKIKELKKNKKIVLVHYNHDQYALQRFAESLNTFIDNNQDYTTVVVSDSILENEKNNYELFKEKYNHEVFHFSYNDPDEMTSLLANVDLVLTCKLHVGVVSALLEKSVIVAACHPEKTKRFYEQINENQRCISLYECNNEQLLNLLEQYKDKKIKIDTKNILESEENWKVLESFLEDKENEKR